MIFKILRFLNIFKYFGIIEMVYVVMDVNKLN